MRAALALAATTLALAAIGLDYAPTAVDLATGARRTARNGRCGDLLNGRWPSW